MLHTKPQGHWPIGSGGEDFWRVFTIYGRGGHIGHVTQTPRTNFGSPLPLRLHMKFGFVRTSGFGEKDLWKWWTTDDDGRLYYNLTNEPKGSGELKKDRKHRVNFSRFYSVEMTSILGNNFTDLEEWDKLLLQVKTIDLYRCEKLGCNIWHMSGIRVYIVKHTERFLWTKFGESASHWQLGILNCFISNLKSCLCVNIFVQFLAK